MTANEALIKMQRIVNEAVFCFDGLGVSTRVETDLMSLHLEPVDSLEKANFISVGIVIGCDGLEEDDEYSVNLVATVHNGKAVNDQEFFTDVDLFNRSVNEAVKTLSESDSPKEGILKLDKIADDESKKILESINKLDKNLNKGIYGIAAGFILLFIILSIFMIFK